MMGYPAKCLAVLKLVLVERLLYRLNFFLQVLSGGLTSLIIVFLWMAVYRGNSVASLGGYTLPEMITYLLGGGLINTFILTTAENNETSQTIADGTLSGLLVQPFSPYWVWFFRDMGTKLFLFLLGLAGYGVVFLFFRDFLIFPDSPARWMFFAMAVALGVLLQFLLFESLSLLAFWVENTYGIRFTMRVILEVTGGAIIPLSFFPSILQAFFFALPFPYLIYLPMTIYLGKTPADEVVGALVRMGLWIAGLAVINVVLWRRGVRRYVAMGD
jgi:viologen exporter family transport system permease protein